MAPFDLISIRRDFHQHPELSNDEFRTQAKIIEYLDILGLETTKIAGTGVKTTIYSKNSSRGDGPHIAFRADIDALPITETNLCPYASAHAGIMHACGHDVHTTVALGIAEELCRGDSLPCGSVTLLFQPAEEATPETEPIGAERMVLEGALENPDIDAIFALHCMPNLDVGTIAYTGGAVWAESTWVSIEVTGRSSHAAYPFEGIDAVIVISNIVMALQTIITRRIDARNSIVLSFGSLNAGQTYNVIADRASLVGTMRTLDSHTTTFAKKEIERLVHAICEGYGAIGKVTFIDGARLTANDLALEQEAVTILRAYEQSELNQEGSVIAKHPAQMAAEDFAAFSSRVPGCYLFLGVRNQALGIDSPLHTSTFDVDEACLTVGVRTMSHLLRTIVKSDRWNKTSRAKS